MNEYVFDELPEARNWNTASSSVGVCPPDHVTCSIFVSSPEPVDFTSRVQPGDGTNESIAKPSGGVSSTFVVVALSFSVGTASVKSWPWLVSATAGLSSACATAPAAVTSAPPSAATKTPKRYIGLFSCRCRVRSTRQRRCARRRSSSDRCDPNGRRLAEPRPGREQERRQLCGEARKRAAHPRGDVTRSSDHRRGDEGKTCLEGDQVAMHGTEEAVQPVPPETGTPVEIRLE